MDNDNNVIEFTPERLNRLRNLKPYRGKSDEEIVSALQGRKPKERKESVKVEDYDIKFNEKLDMLKDEYAIDMNSSNDVEMLRNLVRHQIQLENVNRDIDLLQSQSQMTKDDYAKLKLLGDFQRTVQTSVTELQDKLGISRKIRKEKQTDDIPQWIEGILYKAKTFYDIKTNTIICPKCQIELGRFWINFPREKNEIDLSLTCWKCKEIILYSS